VRITEEGVFFSDGGPEQFLNAERSMAIQEKLGADIIFAFDEPTSPRHDYAYTKEAMARTHRWAVRSRNAADSRQYLYGIVQGGAFADLREESARYIASLDFEGFGIGGAFGTSFGDTAEDTFKELEWTIPFLPEEKPRHFLGIGLVQDLFAGVERGIDTFDCVVPTREARHGSLWTRGARIDITRGRHHGDASPLDPECGCHACAEIGTTRGALYQLFREKNEEAGRLASLHNVYFFNHLMSEIRAGIRDDRLDKVKQYYCAKA
jgi:tRNA-guanine transglycosylase